MRHVKVNYFSENMLSWTSNHKATNLPTWESLRWLEEVSLINKPMAKKKAPAAAAADSAPTWKNYLAVRSESISTSNSNATTTSSLTRPSRKRAQHAVTTANVAPRVRAYWERLSASERQHVLFIDEPELVKQLYKLNLSLLCVGLMQRHLKAPRKAASAASTTTATVTTPVATAAATQSGSNSAENGDATATTTAAAGTPALSTEKAETKMPAATTAAATGSDALAAEKTYELLEAMEFMDIGTGAALSAFYEIESEEVVLTTVSAAGILTVKSDLVELPERLFSLVGDVLPGFASSIHVLSDKQFHGLFVAESEVITTWEDYQRLIAMLVEQLILKSYVSHLEREAALQMEELLLEVSLEDKKPPRGGSANAKESRHKAAASGGGGGGGIPVAAATTAMPSSPSQAASKKKKKKRKKKDSITSAVVDTGLSERRDSAAPSDQPEPEDFEDGGSDNEQQLCSSGSDRQTASSEEDMELANEETVVDEDMCEDDTSEAVKKVPRLGNVASPEKRRLEASVSTRAASSSLNPNALVFQPLQEYGSVVQTPRCPPIGAKRKLDTFVVSVFAEDALSDDEYYWGDDGYNSDDDFPALHSVEPPRRQKVARWREEDAALEWQLQQIYATMSTTHGWDFTHQREIVVEQQHQQPGAAVPWDELALWRTAPTQVVRYFGSGNENGGFGPFYPSRVESHPFATSATATAGTGLSSQQPESRYYFAPPSPLALSSAYLPPPPAHTSSSSSTGVIPPLMLPSPVQTSVPAPTSSSAPSSSGGPRLGSRSRRGYRS